MRGGAGAGIRPALLRSLWALPVGAVCVLGWAPHGLPWVAVLAHAILFALLVRTRSVVETAWTAALFGLGLHALGSGWVLEPMVALAQMPIHMAWAGMALLLLYLSAFSALSGLLFAWVLPPATLWTHRHLGLHGMLALAVFAASMTLGEYLRSLPFNGYTVLSLGYVLVDTPARGLFPAGGTYLASLWAYAIAGLLGWLALDLGQGRGLQALRWPALSGAVLAGLMLALQSVSWVQPSGSPLSFRLIQGNVRQADKFRPETLEGQVRDYLQVITAERADLIVTPETAFPLFLNQLPVGTLERLKQFSNRSDSHVFLGIGTVSALGHGHNSVIGISPGADLLQHYNKIRLMPFGEYSPRGLSWFSRQLVLPMKGMTPGLPDPRPFLVRSGRGGEPSLLGTLNCHEDMQGSDLRHWLPQAQILLNPTNLAWFEGSRALGQRLQMAQARALEAGRPVLRVANTGVSAHIDHLGRIHESAAEGVAAVVTGEVQGMQGRTPYSRFGDVWPVALVFALLLIGRLRTRRQRHAPTGRPA